MLTRTAPTIIGKEEAWCLEEYRNNYFDILAHDRAIDMYDIQTEYPLADVYEEVSEYEGFQGYPMLSAFMRDSSCADQIDYIPIGNDGQGEYGIVVVWFAKIYGPKLHEDAKFKQIGYMYQYIPKEDFEHIISTDHSIGFEINNYIIHNDMNRCGDIEVLGTLWRAYR